MAYEHRRQVPEAIALFERVRDAQIAKLGPDHPDTLTTLNNLAVTYWRQSNSTNPCLCSKTCSSGKRPSSAASTRSTQLTVANLGVNYKDAGRLKEAIPLLEEAHQAAKNFPDASLGRQPIDRRLYEGGRERQARRLAPGAIGRGSKTLPKDSPATGRLLAQIGLSLLQQKKWTEAEPLLRECLAIREKTQPDVWSTFNTKSLLGGALLGQKKYAEAEPLLLAGYEGMKQREKTIPPQARSACPKPSNASSSSTRPRTSPTKSRMASRTGEVSGRLSEPAREATGEAMSDETSCCSCRAMRRSAGNDSAFLRLERREIRIEG